MARTQNTRKLEKFKLQFHQFYYADRYTMPQVTALFHWLFCMLLILTGKEYHASEEQWFSRRREWNTKRKLRRKRMPEPTPVELDGQIPWFIKNGDGLLLLERRLLHVYSKSKRPKFISGVELCDPTMGPAIMRPLSSLDEIIEPDSSDHTSFFNEVESVEDYLSDIPSLYEDPTSAQASCGHGTQPSAAASATINPSADWCSGICSPSNIEAHLGCTASTYHSPYALKDSEGHTSDVPDHQTSSMRPNIGTGVASSISTRAQSTGHKRGQGASFALPLSTPTKSLCHYLPSQVSDSSSVSGSTNFAAMYDHQSRGIEATYDTGPAYAGSVQSGPYLLPYTEPQTVLAPPLHESHSHIHDDALTRTNPQIPCQASRSATMSFVQGTGMRALKRQMRPMPLLPSSSGPGIVNEPGHETPSMSQITSPYPRRPSNHASFLPYNLQ